MSDVLLEGVGVGLSPVSGRSTVDAVLDQLQAQVSGGSWPVGERIPAETDLAAQLGVSRPAVREAIRALVHVGVLEVRRGDGTYVRSSADPRPLLRRVARASIREFFEVQLAYDVQAARLAARRRTDADLDRLEGLLDARDEATGPEAFGTADAAFHLGIAEASRNPVLIEAMRFFIGRLRDALRDIRLDGEIPEAGPAAHRAVLDAIAARDPGAAATAAAAVVEPALTALEALSMDTKEMDAESTNTTAADNAPPENTSAANTASGRTPGNGPGADNTARDNTAVGDSSVRDTSADEPSADDTAAGDTPANDTAANDTGAGETRANDTAVDDTSRGGTARGGVAL